jgi:hypothetical protein
LCTQPNDKKGPSEVTEVLVPIGIGREIMQVSREASIADLQRLKVKRVKRGECPECGTQLFKTSTGMLRRVKKATPINDPGQCMNGRCLVCFPLGEDEEQPALIEPVEKKAAVPRTILTYQSAGMNGMLNGDGAIQEKSGPSVFGLDFDDEVSAITLDRKIRSEEKEPRAASSKATASSERPDPHIRERMKEFLNDDNFPFVFTGDTDDGEEYDEVVKNSKSHPEQAPPRQRTGGDDENNASSKSGFRSKLSGFKSKSEISIISERSQRNGAPAKKVFHPPSVFVPPSSAIEEPQQLIKKKTPTGKVDTAVTPQSSIRPTGEIFFDSTEAFPAPTVPEFKVHVEQSASSGFSAAGTGEETCSSDQDSNMGCAEREDDDSSHCPEDESDEYGEYSSKLLMMLDHADGKNEAEWGTPAHRSPSKPQDVFVSNGGPNQDLSESSYSHAGSSKLAKNTEDTAPTTTDSSQIASDEGSNRHGSGISEDRSSPNGENIKSPRTKSAQEYKMASEGSAEMPESPKRSPLAPFAQLKVKEPGVPELHHSSHDMGVLLQELQTGRRVDHESTLLQITDYLWARGPPAKHQFIANDGMKVLTATMWADMMVPSAERAAAELFLSLVTASSRTAVISPASKAATDAILSSSELSGLIDALLVAMQTLILDDELQQVGCRVLCCLSSSNNSFDNDGTKSGGCLAVLNAMDAHYNSEFVQEWGLRALYNQCVHSKNASANKNAVLTSKLDTTGATGSDVLERILLSGAYHLKDGGVLEWTCRVLWCVTTGGSSGADMLSLRMDALLELLHIMEQCRSMEDASPQLQEAVLGMISNLSRMKQYQSFLGTPDIILLILDTMHGNKEFVEVQIEASGAIANISGLLSPLEKEEIVDAGAVRTIVGAMFAFPREKHILQEPALRALVALARDSEIAKEEICDHETLSVLMHLCRFDDGSTLTQQEALCILIALLYASDRLLPVALHCDSFGVLTSAVAAFHDSEKIQEALCSACRNVSKKVDNLDVMIRYDAIGYAVAAMSAFKFSKSIQSNACFALWNIGIGSEFGHQAIAETNAIDCIVNAIKAHLEVEEVVEVACGALWGLIHRSHVLRQQFIANDSGVESVTCTLVMHPRATSLLEKACGVLALTCTNSRSAAGVIGADGVSSVVETMRNNPKSVNILQHGAHLLRNTINRNQSFVEEAMGAITVLMHALRDFSRNDPFQSEGCNFIWTIAEHSHEAKRKIIATQGIPILRKILDQKGVSSFVKDAALGAYRELTYESTN